MRKKVETNAKKRAQFIPQIVCWFEDMGLIGLTVITLI